MKGIDQNGYLLKYAATPLAYKEPKTTSTNPDQILREKEMRYSVKKLYPDELSPDAFQNINLCAVYSYSSIFLDRSEFCSLPKEISFDAVTAIVSRDKRVVTLRLWTYMAVAVYVNGKLSLVNDVPCYKPIKSIDAEINLNEGINQIVIRCSNLGIRDTYDLFALQVTSPLEGLECILPSKELQERYDSSIDFLDNIKLEKNTVIFPSVADNDTYIVFPKEGDEWLPDYECEKISLNGLTSYKIDKKKYFAIQKNELSRDFQVLENFTPIIQTITDDKERYLEVLKRIAAIKTLDRGDHGFSIFNILARKALNISNKEDENLILLDMGHVERRVDCSDFIIAGLLRYKLVYGFTKEAEENFKRIMLSFRYWMNMKGQDGMCFWSENHSLMFYFSAYLIGRIYPNDYFEKAEKTGLEMSKDAEIRLDEWLDDVINEGFEEFQSAIYMCVTFVALINVFDFAEAKYSKKAEIILNKLLKNLSLSVFDNSVISPMGRVYRDCIQPYVAGTNSVLSLFSPNLTYDYSEGWMAFYATSKFKPDFDVRALIKLNHNTSYTTGNAKIKVKKTENYLLTSLEIPRLDNFTRWENLMLSGKADINHHSYTKSMNERFHGTSCFLPGARGYQQHTFYAALSKEALIFINHPGSTSEHTGHRPGYWYGNALFPMLEQDDDTLMGIFSLDDSVPVKFVHAFIPFDKFDEVKTKDNWIFLRKNDGYIAYWTSKKGYPHNDMLSNAELRYDGNNLGFVIKMGDKEQYSSFDNFINEISKNNPTFNFPTLTYKKTIEFVKHTDPSQVIE